MLTSKNKLVIDLERCSKCGGCAKVCPTEVIEFTSAGPKEERAFLCIRCGHCVAVCPTDAIKHLNLSDEFPSMEKSDITFEQFAKLAQNRRSIRNYKSDPIPEALLAAILQSAKYCPTGSNAQEIKYLVISDPKRLEIIRSSVVSLFSSKLLCSIFSLFFGRTRIKLMQAMTAEMQQGNDFLLRGAPVLIIMHVKKKTPMRYLDAGIAGHHINLACECLGLGACWIGYHSKLCQLFKSVANASLVPKGHEVVGSLVVGYPAIKYYKTCPRRDPSIDWHISL